MRLERGGAVCRLSPVRFRAVCPAVTELTAGGGGTMDMVKGARMPQAGDTVLFRCKKCGHLFQGKLSLLRATGLFSPPKCPQCGSGKTARDSLAVY
jgi:predicted RNA-binding Zn-ribbon protein involved in translation (DUF1610 family)